MRYDLSDLFREYGAPPCAVDQQAPEFKMLLEVFIEAAPSVIVEIGQYEGGTMFYWQRHSRQDAVIVGVDVDHSRFALPSDPRRHLITGDSTDPTVIARVRSFGPIDFLFIDGEHYGDTPKRDFFNYGDLVRPGGVIAVHDINWHRDQKIGIGDVWRAYRGDRYEEFIALPTSMEYAYGIGVSCR